MAVGSAIVGLLGLAGWWMTAASAVARVARAIPAEREPAREPTAPVRAAEERPAPTEPDRLAAVAAGLRGVDDRCGGWSRTRCAGGVCAIGLADMPESVGTVVVSDVLIGAHVWREAGYGLRGLYGAATACGAAFDDAVAAILDAPLTWGHDLPTGDGWSFRCALAIDGRDALDVPERSAAVRDGVYLCDALFAERFGGEDHPFADAVAEAMVDLVVAARDLPAGVAIDAVDVATVPAVIDLVPDGAFLQTRYVVGRTTTRSIAAGALVASAALAEP